MSIRIRGREVSAEVRPIRSGFFLLRRDSCRIRVAGREHCRCGWRVLCGEVCDSRRSVRIGNVGDPDAGFGEARGGSGALTWPGGARPRRTSQRRSAVGGEMPRTVAA